MWVITLRSIVFAIATLATLSSSPARAQGKRSASDASTAPPAIQAGVGAGDEEDGDLVLAEPDFRVLNLPSTLRLPVRGSNFQLTHRFNGNLQLN